MSALICEVVYRGIFQKNLAARIRARIVLSAREVGTLGHRLRPLRRQPAAQRNPRQGLRDRRRHQGRSSSRTWPVTSPSTWTSLFCVDDTRPRCGVLGVVRAAADQQAHGAERHRAMTSLQPFDALLKDIHKKDAPYKLSLIRAKASFLRALGL